MKKIVLFLGTALAFTHLTPASADENIVNWNGAARFQYSYGDYDSSKKDRNGNIDMDTFRLNVNGKINDILFDVEWRWYEYMTTLQRAWIGYDFDDHHQVQLGLTKLPFGNLGYNSHSFFFSSNYYVALEDVHKMGAKYIFDQNGFNLQAAFFKNDLLGGSESYTFNLAGTGGVDTDGNPNSVANSVNTGALRIAQTFQINSKTNIEVGASGVYGGIDDGIGNSLGEYNAHAAHTTINIDRLNIQLQASQYDYRTKAKDKVIVLSGYAYHDTIANKADSYTANIAYHIPVKVGPISGLDIYNDYSLITNKSGGFDKTTMNVTGIGVAAGALYTYFDYIVAKNQPFVGGSMTGNGGTHHRFNANFGFYF